MVKFMKKYVIFLTVVLILLGICFLPYSYGYEESLNSKNLYAYLEENHIHNIQQLCTYDYCDYLRSVNLQKSITLYEQKYEEYLKEKIGSEKAYEVILKGFPITKIVLFNE